MCVVVWSDVWWREGVGVRYGVGRCRLWGVVGCGVLRGEVWCGDKFGVC